MGIDLVFGFITIAALALVAFLLGKKVSAASPLTNAFYFLASLGVCLLFAWCTSGKLAWAVLFSSSAVVYWSNAMPILLGLAAGLATNTPGLLHWHRPVTVSLLGLLGVGYLLLPIARPIVYPVDLNETSQWSGNVCLQSHAASCAPAAAVTLLRLQGVLTSENAMAQACLTSSDGTMPLGLYRGVSLAAASQDKSVGVASSDPSQWLQLGQLPNVAIVQFSNESDSGTYTRLLGTRGEGHAVTVLGKTDAGRWIIGDPAVGRIVWTNEQLNRRFTGEAIYVR